jgi:MFS family permease
MTRALLLVLLTDIAALMSFYLLLSVVPMYATAVGAAETGAGAVTAALMLSSVATELATPRLVARFGYRAMLGAGLVLLAAPALLLTAGGGLTMIIVVCVLRGVGFAIVMVAAGALSSALVPAERRGEGLGLVGAAVCLPGVVGLPLGVWVAGHVGYPAVFVTAAVVAFAGLAVLPGLPGRAAAAEAPVGLVAGLRAPGLRRPAVLFAASATAAGIVVAFLPLAVGELATPALLVESAAATVTRWLAGRYGDRHGPAALLIPGLVTAAAGMLAMVLTGIPVAVLAGMLLFGAGFGAVQSATLTMMLNRVPASGYGTANALWNIAYDAPYGLGPAGFGVLAPHTGYPTAFALTGAVVLTAIVPARRDRRAA